MKELPCKSYKIYCKYLSDIPCDKCVCAGGDYDPRYDYDKQPKKLSKFVFNTREKTRKRYMKNNK